MTPNKFTVHCSDSANGKRVDISEIRKWHLARGFNDIGYHAVIQPDGEVQVGRGLTVVGAHVEGENEGNLGICLVGKDKFTAAQFKALDNWIEDVKRIYQIADQEIYCHYEWPSAVKQGKTCPNMKARNVLWYIATGDLRAVAAYLLEVKA